MSNPTSGRGFNGDAPSRPPAAAPAVSPPAAGVEIRIPLQVTVSLGSPPPMASPAGAAPRGAAFGTTEGLFFGSAPEPTAALRYPFSLAALSATEFDWLAALATALASRLAYEEEEAVRATAVGRWGFASCEVVEVEETQCFVAFSPGTVLLSFRGTESFGDWLGNLNALSMPTARGRVHRGFWAAFELVKARLQSLLADLGDRRLIVTGHSLGGALATLAAADWQGRIPLAAVYTFGQPAVVDASLAAFLDASYPRAFHRFVNDADVVPKVPPGYTHVGQLYHFDASGNLARRTESRAAADFAAEDELLSEAEFDRLRAEILARSAERKARRAESPGLVLLDGPPITPAAAVDGGPARGLQAESRGLSGWLLGGVFDHSLDEYLPKIARQAR